MAHSTSCAMNEIEMLPLAEIFCLPRCERLPALLTSWLVSSFHVKCGFDLLLVWPEVERHASRL